MTDRASIQLVRGKRAPPSAPKQTTALPTMTFSSTESVQELARAIAELQRLDCDLMRLDGLIDQHEHVLTKPDTDPWDLVDTDQKLDSLWDQRSKASWDVMQAANRVIHHGVLLIDEWRDVELDNIARQLSIDDGLFDRVAIEWPGIPEHPVWQRLEADACPF